MEMASKVGNLTPNTIISDKTFVMLCSPAHLANLKASPGDYTFYLKAQGSFLLPTLIRIYKTNSQASKLNPRNFIKLTPIEDTIIQEQYFLCPNSYFLSEVS